MYYSAIYEMFLHTNSTNAIVICLIKIVDDLLATGSNDQLRLFVKCFGKMFSFCFVAYDPGC